MSNRWSILFVLFFARLAMAFQFQSVAALSPIIVQSYAVSLVDIGLLIGLYLGPGVVVAIPGGTIAARFGDKRVVALSLAMMVTGSALAGLGTEWGWLVTGRLLAGVGGVIINIVMTKMLVDWFVGREIATAMGFYIGSWPLGIALALLTLPGIAAMGGLGLAWFAIVLIIALALALFLFVYHPPPTDAGPVPQLKSKNLPWLALLSAASIWAFYNAAFSMLFSFGPLLLTERGLSATMASSTVSIFIIFCGIFIPLGGVVADRTGRRDTVIMTSLVGCAILLPAVLYVPLSSAPWTFAIGGLILGLGAGPIMTLPSLILRPEARAFGMGVFFAIYYAVMMVAPTIAGAMADRAGKTDVTFLLGSGMLILCVAALALFRRVAVAPGPER